MNKLSLAALTAALVVGGAEAAYSGNQVISVSGPTTSSDILYYFPYVGTGSYFLSFTSSIPLYQGLFENVYQYIFNQYDEYGNYIGGDENDIARDFYTPINVTQFSEDIYIPPLPQDYNLYYPDGALYEQDFFSPYYSDVYLFYGSNAGPGTFTFTLTSAPEPSTWTLMLIGFGALGRDLRRRRSALTKSPVQKARTIIAELLARSARAHAGPS